MIQNIQPLQNLFFRRGYFLGPLEFKPTEYWQSHGLNNGLQLSYHSDLHITLKKSNDLCVVLVGIAVDALSPHENSEEIIDALFQNSKDIESVIAKTYSYAGRWLIIFQDHYETYMFSDPCGFRQVFYINTCDGVLCASQPEIINAVYPMQWRTDQDMLDFLYDRHHTIGESVWIGNQTIYQGCCHLLPNHYLKVKQASEVRFYPANKLPTLNTSSIIESSVTTLENIILGITKQYNVMQAITAGWDSRILLAASKECSSSIEYYMDRMGILPNVHKDVVIPKILAKKLDINFRVDNSKSNPPGWFISILSKNVTAARVLPKTRPIFNNLISGETRINLNGNGSEICRSWFDQYCLDQNYKIDNNLLPGIMGFYNSPYVIKIINEWKEDLYSKGGQDRNVLDMLYWEQRLGNWGALYAAERDIAIEEFSPFNCRLYIDTLLSSDRSLRRAPKYELFFQMINTMWPETLFVPINPLSKRPGPVKWKSKLRPYIPKMIKNPFRRRF